MHLKTKRLTAIVLVITMAFQFAGCLGITNGFEGKPSDTISTLESAIQSLNYKNILVLTTIDKGSSRYKEYSEILNMESYGENAAKCYEAVASAIKVSYDEDSIETGKDIVKVAVTFSIPEWRKVFEDSSLSGVDSVTEAIAKAEKENTTITLRLINTKDGLRIKNADELFEIFDFVGYEIAALSDEPAPTTPSTDETEPSESSGESTKATDPSFKLPTDPSETEPTEPSESSRTTEPSESSRETSKETDSTEPAKKGTKEDLAKAYADYAKRLKDNKDKLEWFEKNMNSNSCGLVDLTGDDIPELYMFCKSSDSSNFISFTVYSYDPSKQKTSMILIDTLIDPESKISEFFVLRTKDNKIVSYKGYLDDSGSISEYSIYSSKGTGRFMEYSGNMFLTLGPEVKDKNGKSMQIKVCTVTGVDKYTSQTTVEVDEFRRIEKALIGSPDSVFSASYKPNFNSVPYQLLGKNTSAGLSYSELLRKLDT